MNSSILLFLLFLSFNLIEIINQKPHERVSSENLAIDFTVNIRRITYVQ